MIALQIFFTFKVLFFELSFSPVSSPSFKKSVSEKVFLTKKANFRVTSGNGIVTPIFYKRT